MKAVEIKLPFGLNKNDTLVHISDVESGKKCACVCPSCRSPLIAVKGTKNQHHFRHDGNDECASGFESAIHLAAKKIIKERKSITLPEYISRAELKDSRGVKYAEEEVVVQNGTVISFDEVEEEIELHGIKADILAIASNKQLIIEIFYRHKVDDEKSLKIVKANISTIEINLSDLTPEDLVDWDSFWLYINDPERIEWLYNAKAHGSVYRNLEVRVHKIIQEKEKQYKREEIDKQREEVKEKKLLLQALEDLRPLYSKKHMETLSQNAEIHQVWQRTKKYLKYSWLDLPDFLSVEVPNGDWIFDCDRRVWQSAFYSCFICHLGKPFTVKGVDDWLQKGGCKIPECAKIVGIYGRKYYELVPDNILADLPSSWRTLRAYFDHLCDLGMLIYSGPDKRNSGSSWYEVLGKEVSPLILKHSTRPKLGAY